MNHRFRNSILENIHSLSVCASCYIYGTTIVLYLQISLSFYCYSIVGLQTERIWRREDSLTSRSNFPIFVWTVRIRDRLFFILFLTLIYYHILVGANFLRIFQWIRTDWRNEKGLQPIAPFTWRIGTISEKIIFFYIFYSYLQNQNHLGWIGVEALPTQIHLHSY